MILQTGNSEEYFGPKDKHDAWVSEAIWGHRLERQPFSALLLEFLGMAEGMHRQNQLFTPTRPGENPQYIAHRSLQLRNILFNNPRMEEILQNCHGSDDEAWRQWLQVMKETASVAGSVTTDFSYLRKRFDSFAELVTVVRLLRRITVDPGAERSWTTQFVFPIGPAALYEALLEKNDGFERTRRVFTRTGELAYLMLTRASEPLRAKLREGLKASFDPQTSRNKLVLRLISSPEPDPGDRKGGTYLPYLAHPAYDRMAEDFTAILGLQLPDQDGFQYLQPLLGLHLYLYGLETANHWAGKPDIPSIVCEILAPRSDLVRKAAVESYLTNDSLGGLAVRTYLDRTVFSDPKLQETLQSETLDDEAKREYLIELLERRCALNREKIEGSDAKTVRQSFHTLTDRLHRSGTADGITALGTGCGLVSKRNTNRFRYAPTDELLRALVLANVTAPVEETVFLRDLYARYRLVVGPAEAKSVVPPHLFDETDFKKNRERFAQHLIGMGLARRMSDACTYIINPMDRCA